MFMNKDTAYSISLQLLLKFMDKDFGYTFRHVQFICIGFLYAQSGLLPVIVPRCPQLPLSLDYHVTKYSPYLLLTCIHLSNNLSQYICLVFIVAA